MRYFKYHHSSRTERKANKAIRSSWTKEEKKQYRKAKFFSSIGQIVFYLVSGTLFGLSVLLISLIPEAEAMIVKIAYAFLKVVLHMVSAIISIALGILAAIPILSKYKTENTIKRQMLTNAASYLRKYYDVNEPYLITKCYDASNENFTNHDVCLFIASGELRITGNLDYGFLHAEKDLGCSVRKKEEISLRQIPKDTTYATELTAGDVRFLLGARAKKFIERNLP